MKISVVIPVYNLEAYLMECLDSVAGQSFTDWECICVDDGSTDGSAGILDDYARRDTRFRVVHQENKGVGFARNAALDLISGDFVFFLDGDDLLINSAVFELFVKTIRQLDETCLVLYAFSDWDGEKARPVARDFEESVALFDTTRFVNATVAVHSFFCGLYPRALIGDVRFPSFRVGEDRLFFAKILVKASSVAVHPANIYVYRRRPGSAMSRYSGARDLRDSISWRIEECVVYQKCGKSMSKENMRNKALFLTCHAGFRRVGFSVDERSILDPVWKNALRLVRGSSGFPLLSRIAAAIALWFPFDLTYRLVFWLPLWLKFKTIRFKQ